MAGHHPDRGVPPGHDDRLLDPVVFATEARRGDRGERLLVEGTAARLRLWDGEPAGEEAPTHANDHEYLAYVIGGRLRLRIGDDGPVTVGTGDSYRVPAHIPYSFQVLERATVLEAVSGGSAIQPTAGPTIADERLPG